MKPFIILITVLTSFVSVGQSKDYKKMLEKYYDDFPTISIEEAKKKVGDPGVIFLDTREINEYEVSHIEGARNVEYDYFAWRVVRDIPLDKEVIVYCSIGARSQDIGKRLKEEGYTNVKNLYGGLFHWSNSEYPMVDNKGAETTNIHGYSAEWGKWITSGNVVY